MRKNLNHQMEKHMDEMADVLPLKLRARDEIRSHFELTREYKTLSTVASKRNLKVLEKENKAINDDIEKLVIEINEKNKAIVDLNVKGTDEKLRLNKQKKLYELVQGKRNDLRSKICEINVRMASMIGSPKVLFDNHNRFFSQHSKSLQILNELEDWNVNHAEHLSDKYFKLQTQIEAIRWKLTFKAIQNEAELKKELKQFQLTLSTIKSSVSDLKESLKENYAVIERFKAKASAVVPLDIAKLNKEAEDHFNEQITSQKRILDLDKEIFNCQRNILDSDELIGSVAAKGQANMSTIETLQAIEEFVMKSPELAADYLGPVFHHLKTDTGMDVKMWSQLETFANILLFNRGSTAREVNRRMVASGLKLGVYILLGLNEFVPSAFNLTDHEMTENIKSAELLVPDDSPIKVSLKLLLRHIIMIDENDLSLEELSNFPQMTIHSNVSMTTLSQKFVTIQSTLPNYAETEDLHPIFVLQNVYAIVKQRLSEKKRLEEVLNVRNQIQEQVQENEKEYKEAHKTVNNVQAESISVVAFQQILIALKEKMSLERRYRFKTLQVQEMMKMSENILNNLTNWDITALKNTMQEMKLQLLEEEKQSKELEANVEIRKKKLEISIGVMEHLKKVLLKSFINMVCRFDDITESSIAYKNAFLKLCQEKLAWYKEQVEKSKEELQEAIQPVIISSQLHRDLLKIRCQFYEKNSEQDVVLNAIKHCKENINVSDDVVNFDQKIYDKYRHESDETIKDAINECLKKLQTHKISKTTEPVTRDRYGHLVKSIKKVEEFCKSPDQAPILRNKIVARSCPVINKVIVKELKDAVHNYSLAFNSTMVDYVKDSKLFFYTHGLFDEVNVDDFSWDCFDLSRLKAMDFVVNWKIEGKGKIGSATLRMIKGLLLIMYIISYISIFKFIIIDEKIYEVSDKKYYFTCKINLKHHFLKGHRRDS